MKHRGISLLLVLTFLLSVFMFCTTAFAAPATQDGITAELITDKEEYADGEPMEVSLKVKNINPRAGNIRTELILPNGILLNTGALVSGSLNLAPNQNAEIDYGLTAGVPSTTTTTTQATTAAPITTGSTTVPATTGSTTVPATTGSTTTVPATTVPATTGSTTTVPATTVPATTGSTTTVPATTGSTTTVPATTGSTTTVPATTVPATTGSTTTVPATTGSTTTVPATTGSATAPTTAAGTTAAGTTAAGTVAPTTGAVTPGGPSDTGDAALYFFGALAIFSLIGLIVVFGGFKNLAKNRWFILVLCCALLVGAAGTAVAYAAASDKTITVTKTVKVAGVDVVLKAEVTYDLLDDAVQTEQVEFKKDGQFLWNKDVEMGYYLPSDIPLAEGTTSKDGSFRPEVTPPYIDMLFGCTSTQTNQFVAGEFTTDIFNDAAQKTALIGLTDDPASRAALELIDEDEWIVTVIDGKLVVTGWYDNATAAAARALYALGSVNAADITLELPMIGKMDYVDVDLPKVPFGKFLGGMDSDQDVVVLRWNEVVADDFDTYCAALVEAGYTQYEYNTLDGFKKTKTLEFATYVKGEDAVLVQYLPVSLLDEDPTTLTSAEKKAQEATYSADGDAIRLILTKTSRLTTNDANNTGWDNLGITPKLHAVNVFNFAADGNAIGQSQIFTLADGSFIVVDGGHEHSDAEQLYRALKYLNERPDGKIVIAAWFITHDHRDHSGCIDDMSNSEWASEITVEQIVLNDDAKSYTWRNRNAPYRWSYGAHGAYDRIEQIAERFGDGNCKVVVPHMGQNIKIRNAEVEILTVSDEDLYPVLMNNDNGMSQVFRVSFPELEGTDKSQSTLILGDTTLDFTYNVFFPLMADELYCDIVQVAHHGLGGQTSRFYPMFKGVDVALWPTDHKTIEGGGLMGGNNSYLQEFDPLNVICEEYIMTFELPFDAKNDEVIRTKVGTFKSEIENLTMDITMLPAFRFQGQWAAKKDVIIDYLKQYSADLLILPLIDQNTTTKYNKADVVNGLYEALDYNYIYYAPVWGCEEDANMTTGDGTMGHVILSVYPILRAETGILVEGTPDASPEGRGYAHVLLDVEGTQMDVVATHFNDAGNWTKFGEIYEQWSAYSIIAGNTKIGGNPGAVGLENASAAFASDVTLLASEGITFKNVATDSRLKTENDPYFVNANMSAVYTATAVFGRYLNMEPVRLSFNANGGSGTMAPVNTRIVLYPLPECGFTAPEGMRFKGWATSQAGADAGEVIRSLRLTEDTELYAVWTSKNTILISSAFANFKGNNTVARDFFVDYYTKNDFDVLALNCVQPTVDVEQLAQDIGFPYFYVSTNPGGTECTVLISKFAITNPTAFYYNNTDPMLYATLNANGTLVDICIGQHHSIALRSFTADFVKTKYDPSHQLIITGYNSKAQATHFDATNVPLSFTKGVCNSLYYSKGLVYLNGGTDDSYNPPVSSMWAPTNIELDPGKYTVSFNANGGTGTMAAAEGNLAGVYTPPASTFTAPSGAKFLGWALTPTGDVVDSVRLTKNTTLYARWEAETLKVLSWQTNVFGGSTSQTATGDANIVAILNEIKAEDPAIAVIQRASNQRSTYTVAQIVEASGYPYFYYSTANTDYPNGEQWYGNLVLSKYPLSYDAGAELFKTATNWYVGYCVVDLGACKVDLFTGVDIGAATVGSVSDYIASVHALNPRRDFIACLTGNNSAKTTFGGVAVSQVLDVNKADILASTRNLTHNASASGVKAKPAALSSALIADELISVFKVEKRYNVSFNSNGGSGTMTTDEDLTAGAYTLPECGFTAPNGGKFLGWALTPDGEVINSLTLNKDVTLYARWEADSVKVMSWNVNLLGTSNLCADAIIAEIKAQDADIVGLINVGNQPWSGSQSTYSLDKILGELGYPHYYFLPVNQANTFVGNDFYGHLIISKYPLSNKVSSDYQIVGQNYFGHCVAELGNVQVDLYIANELNEHAQFNTAALSNKIQESLTPGNDFIVFAQGKATNDATIAGKGVVVGAFDDNIAVIASNAGLKVESTDIWMQEKPSAIKNHANGSRIVSNEALMNISIVKRTVSFDANGGGGTMADLSLHAGVYTLPDCTFEAPSGKRFFGWATAPNGSVIRRLYVNGDMTLYPVWVDASTVYFSTSFANIGDSAANRAYLINYYTQNTYDLVALNCVPLASVLNGGLDALAEEMGYKYACYAVNSNNTETTVLLSQFPITAENHAINSTAAPILFATVNINGRLVDVCCGQLTSMAQRGNVAAALAAKYDPTHDLIVAGNQNSAYASAGSVTLPGVDLTVLLGDYSHIWTNNALQQISGSSDMNYAPPSVNMCKPTNLELKLGQKYTVSFDANGGSGSMKNVAVIPGAYTLPECTFTAPSGAVFTGWATAPNGNVISSLNVTENVTLYAVWDIVSYTVTFNANGGSGTMVNDTTVPGSYALPANGFTAPTGKRFKGWATSQTDAAAGTVARRLTVSGDTILYAVWADAESIFVSNLYNNYVNDTAGLEYSKAYYKQNVFDIVTMNCVPVAAAQETTLKAIADELGFPYYLSAVNAAGTESTLLFSKFEITASAKLENSDGNPVIYATVNANGRLIDVLSSQISSIAKRNFVISTIGQKYDPTHELIISGNNSGSTATHFDAANVALGFYKGSYSNHYYTAGLTFVGGETDTAFTSPAQHVNDPVNVELKLSKNYTVSFDANGGTGTMTAVTTKEGAYTLPANGFTAPNGGKFLGWSLTKDGPVIDSLTLNSNVTLYARWQAVNLKVMGWRIGNLGATNNNYTAIINEVKAQNPDIVGLMLADNSAGWHADKTPQTIANDLPAYPFYYYVSEYGTDTETTWKGHIIFSKFPLTDKVESNHEKTSANAFIGHCVVDLGTFKLDLFATSDMRMATRDSLYAYVQTVTATSGNDFVILASGALPTDLSSCAGKTVATSADGSKIATVVSLSNLKLESVVAPFDCSTIGNYGDSVCKETIVNVSVKQSYTVSFNANGGTGTMTAVTANEGAYTLPANGFVAPTGKRFIGWSLTENGEVLTSLDLTEGVTLYAQWGADTLKVMSWNVNLFGVSDAMADAVVAEVKAQNPDIVGLQNVGNQAWRSSNTSYTLDNILEKMGYPYSYYVPLSASYVYTDDNFYGMLILSKYPLTNKTAAGDLLHGTNYVGHCVADLGTAQVDLYIARELKAANRGDLYNLIQSNTTAGNDFILFAAGGVAADATIAGKSVAVATYDANIAVVASTVNQSVGTDDMQKVTKPAAISENTNGNAIIGNEALMTITIN